MKIFRKKRTGAAQLYVIAALILVSLFTAFTVHVLQGDIYQMHAYELQMQAYYLSDEAASAAVSALLEDDDDSLLRTGHFPMEDTMTHSDNGTELGTSKIRMCRETHPYYGEDAEWIVIRITTEMPDPRVNNPQGTFRYQTTVSVLVSNPLVRLYNINPEDL